MATAQPTPSSPTPKPPPIHPTTLPVGPGRPSPPATPPVESGPEPEGVRSLPAVAAAITAEAQRRGVDDAAVRVVSHDEVTWPDGSIGCPQPGMVYTQALVPGRRLVLEVDGEQASYHAGRDAEFGHCATPTKALPAEADPTR